MGLSTKVRRMMVEAPGSLGERSRVGRWELLRRMFPAIEDMNVVDLGGRVESWERAPVKPAHVTVLNLTEPGESNTDRIVPVVGDACDAERALSDAASRRRFDLVFSNAVLEHVGGHANRLRFADSVRKLAPSHWVQTPYRYFPIEPHWLFPGMQFFPVAVRSRIAVWWPLSHSPAASLAAGASAAMWTELIGLTEMRYYFPESQIVRERFGGLTKSIIAVRSN